MKKKHGQMSEAFLTAALLSVSGGLQDAYTYIARGQVFANAQTGNNVLLSQNLFSGNWARRAPLSLSTVRLRAGGCRI